MHLTLTPTEFGAKLLLINCHPCFLSTCVFFLFSPMKSFNNTFLSSLYFQKFWQHFLFLFLLWEVPMTHFFPVFPLWNFGNTFFFFLTFVAMMFCRYEGLTTCRHKALKIYNSLFFLFHMCETSTTFKNYDALMTYRL